MESGTRARVEFLDRWRYDDDHVEVVGEAWWGCEGMEIVKADNPRYQGCSYLCLSPGYSACLFVQLIMTKDVEGLRIKSPCLRERLHDGWGWPSLHHHATFVVVGR